MYADYKTHLAANRAYAKTEAGKAAKARSHAKYLAKRKELSASNSWTPASSAVKPLAEVLSSWSRT